MDQPPRRSRYFEVEAPARPLRKRPRPGETARLEALRSYLAARGVAAMERLAALHNSRDFTKTSVKRENQM